jgi:hypothetical protein
VLEAVAEREGDLVGVAVRVAVPVATAVGMEAGEGEDGKDHPFRKQPARRNARPLGERPA